MYPHQQHYASPPPQPVYQPRSPTGSQPVYVQQTGYAQPVYVMQQQHPTPHVIYQQQTPPPQYVVVHQPPPVAVQTHTVTTRKGLDDDEVCCVAYAHPTALTV